MIQGYKILGDTKKEVISKVKAFIEVRKRKNREHFVYTPRIVKTWVCEITESDGR